MKNDFREYYDVDYILHSVTEEDYLEHGLKDRIHKYIKKLKNKYGKWRYIYKQYKKDLHDADNLRNQAYVDNHSQLLTDTIQYERGIAKEDADYKKRRKEYDNKLNKMSSDFINGKVSYEDIARFHDNAPDLPNYAKHLDEFERTRSKRLVDPSTRKGKAIINKLIRKKKKAAKQKYKAAKKKL